MAAAPIFATVAPQWSPVMKTGNTSGVAAGTTGMRVPQWSPVMKTGNTLRDDPEHSRTKRASMEPGHEDREYLDWWGSPRPLLGPQWSPVMKTGNTGSSRTSSKKPFVASMEPGHEDREYVPGHIAEMIGNWVPQWSPVMKTGNTRTRRTRGRTTRRLNGARS